MMSSSLFCFLVLPGVFVSLGYLTLKSEVFGGKEIYLHPAICREPGTTGPLNCDYDSEALPTIAQAVTNTT